MLKAFKYRIKPNPQQIQMFEEHFGACRFVFNRGLELKTKTYQTTGDTLTCNQIINRLSDWKKEHIWLKNVNAQALQMSLRNLDNAYTRFFKEKKGFSKFKSKHNPRQYFQCPQSCSVDFENSTLSLAKIKQIKTVFHRRFEGNIKTVTISRQSTGKYFVSILVEDGLPIPEKPTPDKNDALGIDVGLKHFLTTSEGQK